jgi:hypothetical protein
VINQYSGQPYRITTSGHHGGHGVARVKTYPEVFEEYEWHPESKCADALGEPAGKQAIGLLQRRHVSVDQIIYIGRESNQLEEVDAGTIPDAVWRKVRSFPVPAASTISKNREDFWGCREDYCGLDRWWQATVQ